MIQLGTMVVAILVMSVVGAGTVGIGVATTLLTPACGPIVERFGAHGFWAMAALCAAALPLARTLREPTVDPG